MKVFPTENLRNIGLLGHAAVGKTSLAEAMLFSSGAVNRLGSIDDGSTTSDYHSEEISRKFSISTSLLHSVWKDHKVNIVDTPGYSDFVGEVYGAIRAIDAAVILASAVSGVEVGTENAFHLAKENNKPSLFFVNLCDREHADFGKAVDSLKQSIGDGVIPVQLPVNAGEGFSTIVDLIKMKVVVYNEQGKGSAEDIPGDFASEAEAAREQLIETVAECDDELLEKFFDAGELTQEELCEGLKKGIAEKKLFPVLCGSGTKACGAEQLLDFVVAFCPNPSEVGEVTAQKTGSDEAVTLAVEDGAPLSALVFKTLSEQHLGELSFFRIFSGHVDASSEVFNSSQGVSEKFGQLYVMNGKTRADAPKMSAGDIGAVVKLKDTHTGNTICQKANAVKLPEIKFPEPVIRVAVESRNKGDEDKIGMGLSTLHQEDPSFSVVVDPELSQTIISGQGELHLDIIVKRICEKYGVEIDQKEPKIPYREAIRGKAEGQSKFKKQSGGRGQYGDVHLRLEPLPRGSDFEFLDEIVGGVVPTKFIPAVEKGIREAMVDGVLAGYPVVDVKVALFYGSYHNVDSSDMAFKIAASMGFKKLFREANPVLLEPIYDVEVRVPEEYMGDIMGDISSRRGKISGMDSEGSFQIIKAKAPLAELYKYSTTIRSLTQGKGIHRRKFSHYEEVPRDVQEKIIEEHQAAKDA